MQFENKKHPLIVVKAIIGLSASAVFEAEIRYGIGAEFEGCCKIAKERSSQVTVARILVP
jgi:hypothetical protein